MNPRWSFSEEGTDYYNKHFFWQEKTEKRPVRPRPEIEMFETTTRLRATDDHLKRSKAGPREKALRVSSRLRRPARRRVDEMISRREEEEDEGPAVEVNGEAWLRRAPRRAPLELSREEVARGLTLAVPLLFAVLLVHLYPSNAYLVAEEPVAREARNWLVRALTRTKPLRGLLLRVSAARGLTLAAPPLLFAALLVRLYPWMQAMYLVAKAPVAREAGNWLVRALIRIRGLLRVFAAGR